ncbi:MAG: polyphosphate kinase 1 [Ignavibacteria bacterium]|jgi:polyphosphate kinase|nr:polyphosphate kinase 1 [Ignavibacteria bacterium]MDH7527598.1 polyphosphate kinase 1 [Ignavibacteria bacterium]NPV12231.1 polyphosphate kinase 1 [Ignavibacteria bacterium]
MKNNLKKFKDPQYYFNRDLSWIEFNRRVLEEALDKELPLLERVKFLSIFCTNLDEFYMIRVSGLMEQISAGISNIGIDGLTPIEALNLIKARVDELLKIHMNCYLNDVLPSLKENGIEILNYDDLEEDEQNLLKQYYIKEIFPTLTPLAFDPGRPFPHISNLSLNLGVRIEKPTGERHFARVKVPKNLPRFININQIKEKLNSGRKQSGKIRLTYLEQVIQANLESLFPKMHIIDSYLFRVTRDTDIEIQEDEADDLLKVIEENIRQRKFGAVVRLEIENELPTQILNLLKKNLEISDESIQILNGPLSLGDLISLYDLPFQNLKFKPFSPSIPKVFEENDDIFSAIKKNDILLSHPYHSFLPVINFLRAASTDPDVLTIKQTLYRVGSNSPIVENLIEAAENGKQVAALVELKARFDEENNIQWARRLEKVGVHVVYGLVGLKTHCKVTLVIRREGTGLRRYVHLSTGNYNITTARQYSDLGLFTCDEDIADDVTELFNYLTGYSEQDNYKELLIAPINMREKLIELIEEEIQSHKKYGNGYIIIKVNSITDPEMIQTLYRASCEGVKIDLLVRGICMLKPGIKGVSENIKVISIVGRFLEHSRVFYFYNNGNSKIYSGSADLMERNLNRRVEVIFPIKSKVIGSFILNNILKLQLSDNVNARVLDSSGKYSLVQRKPEDEVIDSQDLQIKAASDLICWEPVRLKVGKF